MKTNSLFKVCLFDDAYHKIYDKGGTIVGINKRKHLNILSLILLLIISGCSNDTTTSQYQKSAKEFNSIYFEIVECIDLGNTIKSLESLHSEEKLGKIKKLGSILKEINKNIPKEREELYNTFKNRYENLVFIYEAYPNFNNLNENDRGKIDSIFISIVMDKDNWNDKNSSLMWY